MKWGFGIWGRDKWGAEANKIFDSYIAGTKTFNIYINTAGTSFDSYITSAKSFSVELFGYQVTASWNINFIQHLNILVTQFLQTLRLFQDIDIPATIITFTAGMLKLGERLFVDWDIPEPVFDIVFKQNLKVLNTVVTIPVSTLAILVRVGVKIPNVSMAIPPTVFAASAVVQQYYHLYDYDPDALHTMDSTALEDLDFQTI